jgi:ATP-dependent Clp protease ATP-binding subunit ClpA
MLERLTADAQQLIVAADAQARRLGHRWIGCEHLLLAACGRGDPVSDALNGIGVTPDSVEAALQTMLNQPPAAMDARALATIGIDLDTVRRRVEAVFGPGALSRSGPRHRCSHRSRRRYGRRRCEAADDALPFTPRAKQAFELASRRARSDGRVGADVQDVAGALIDVPDSMPRRILDRLRVSAGEAHRALGTYRRAG